MKKRTKNTLAATALSALLAAALSLVACYGIEPNPLSAPPPASSQSGGAGAAAAHTEAIDMSVSVIDVGQGDSILIMSEGYSLLIDAGDRGAGTDVVAYLKAQGVARIDYIVATHGDADHIGGMAEVLRTFEVNHDIIAPKLPGSSETYGVFVKAVENEPGVSLTTPSTGTTFSLGDATVQIIANGNGKQDTNESSIVLRVLCGGRSALFTGDIPEQVELQLVAADAPLDSDLLKVAHHGSRGSSCAAFLNTVNPDYAVISSGGRYGHPHEETLERLRAVGAQIWRTDERGNIVFLFSDDVIVPQRAA